MKTLTEHLQELTNHVILTRGPLEANRFYSECLIPIKTYFGGDIVADNLHLREPANDVCPHPEKYLEPYKSASVVCTWCNCIVEQAGNKLHRPIQL